jgi:uncharacterized protein (TIGR02145 family)
MNRTVIISFLVISIIGCNNGNDIQPFEPSFTKLEYPDTLTTFTDPRDSRTYYQISIGDQVWMAENLSFNAGGAIGYTVNDEENYPGYQDVYGLLYSYNEAKDACPPGWRLPSDEDWKVLEARFGMTEYIGLNNFGRRGTSQANLMKSDSPHWKEPYTQSGTKKDMDFFVLPAGYYSPQDRNCHDLGVGAGFLTSSFNTDSTLIIIRHFAYYSTLIDRSAISFIDTTATDLNYRFSVRCIKD